LHDQFEVWLPALNGNAGRPNGQPPRKITLGAWLLPALSWRLRPDAAATDLFGRSEERRLERQLIVELQVVAIAIERDRCRPRSRGCR
jgi:hypothetical protein